MHTHLPTPWSADWSAFYSILKKRPLFLSYYNDIVGAGVNRFIASGYNRTALTFLLRSAQRIFVNQKNLLKTSPFLGPYREKTIIVPLGVDMDKFKPLACSESKGNTVFFLSKLDAYHRYKGLDCLLLSIKKIIDTIAVHLYVGGAGELLGYYRRIVKEQGLEHAVTFTGFLRDEEIVAQYNKCDVFVLPSTLAAAEGFGLVALEAMACKKPVIVSEIVGAAEEIQRAGAGIVVPPQNVEELSRALKYIFLNKTERERMADNAYRLIREKYSWKSYVDVVEAEYLKINKKGS
jgi:glycosyltransferase involved in cell wall biosynthesis